jgi:hypothetical protein
VRAYGKRRALESFWLCIRRVRFLLPGRPRGIELPQCVLETLLQVRVTSGLPAAPGSKTTENTNCNELSELAVHELNILNSVNDCIQRGQHLADKIGQRPLNDGTGCLDIADARGQPISSLSESYEE